MVQKPGRNYAPNKPVTIADLSSSAAASEVDYERERQNLKFKKKHDGAITDAAARNNQSRHVHMSRLQGLSIFWLLYSLFWSLLVCESVQWSMISCTTTRKSTNLRIWQIPAHVTVRTVCRK